MKNVSVKVLSGLGLSLLMSSVWAGTITDIKVSSLSDDQKIIKIQFKDGVTMPQGFMTDTPPRVALDFAGTDLNVAQNVLQFNDPLLQEITAASDSARTRVALTLNKQGQYNVERKDDAVWVYVKTAGSAAAPVVATAGDARYAPVSVSVTREQNQAALNTFGTAAADANVDMKFSKGAQNSGVMQFTLPARHAEPKVQRSGNTLTLTFPNMPLQAAAQKNYDVAEFGTPVRKVALQRVGNNTKITITNGSGWDYSVKDQGTAYVVTVSQQADLFNTLDERPKPKSFKGGRITLDFQDVDVRTILQILAKESGMNIVASDTVQGRMTLNLKDVPWDQALDLVMQARNLDMRRQGNIINIAPRQELLAQDRQIMQGQKELNEMGPLLSRTFQLKYKSVEDFKGIFTSVQSGSSSGNNAENTILSARGSVMMDPGTNTLILTDNQNVINKFEKLIAQLDVPVRQVMIEARIVEASENFLRDLGVKWGFQYSKQAGDNTYRFGPPNQGRVSQNTGTGTGTGTNSGIAPNISLPAMNATSGLTYVLSRGSNLLGLELTAMQQEGDGKIISSPRILTQDRQEATLEEGQDVPYQEATSSGATSTTFKKAVTGLTVTPQITPDGNVIMKLKINKDEVDSQFNDGRMNVKRLETTAMVENGGTMVVGGIYVEKSEDGYDKVPLLGDLPVLGNLFKRQQKTRQRRELLIFITPRIMDSLSSDRLDY
ncbi:MAG: type IV pilus secretin PilQ [Neisseria sp.]|nr:type IV pilus secretin PilQ [Neisseria sp.]